MVETGFTTFQIAGILGVVTFVTVFAAAQLGVINVSRLAYSILITVAAAAVLFSTVERFDPYLATASAAIFAVSLIGLARRMVRRLHARRRVDGWLEQNFMKQHFSSR